MKQPAAPNNLRNGLSWRDGRPRWEPSPANRKLGLKGKDLKDDAGGWLDRGMAIGAADKRRAWADVIREAHDPGPAGDEARRQLRKVLDDLPAPADAGDRHARALVADLIEAARAHLEHRDVVAGVALMGGPRTVGAMFDGYFADPTLTVTASTLDAYRTQAKKVRAKFEAQRVDTLTTGQLRAWYLELVTGQVDGRGPIVKPAYGLATANQAVGAFAAALQWARFADWIQLSPAAQLKLQTPAGRRIFWTMAEEAALSDFCDSHGFADVTDGVVAMLWTGARPVDICAANLPDLMGRAWRYVPVKTRKSQREALPGLTPPLQARVAMVAARPIQTRDRAYLVKPSTGRRHTPDTLNERFREMLGLAAAMGINEPWVSTLQDKQLRDCRDTCITRLWESVPDIKLDGGLLRICNWTAHALKDAEEVLRDHYVCLREEAAEETAAHLMVWAAKNGVKLS